MKTQIIFYATLLTAAVTGNLNAQDTLQYRDGRLEAANVTEITTTLIKFKKAEMPDGPLYSELKNDLVQIRFSNGSVETFDYQAPEEVAPVISPTEFIVVKHNPELREFGPKYLLDDRPISNREMHSYLLGLNDRQITKHIRLAKDQAQGQYVGFLAIPCGIAAGYFALVGLDSRSSSSDNLSAAGLMAGIGVISFATSITLKVKRTNNERAAVKLYNQKY